ncbi:hypothetical protein L596_018723 [Steinernema carpocapsae]|uniref:Uncharacterized protein n=1 Tax=Steinernema carpocapsae TaxID=34508 RepID=A0A4V6A242_STECR|nr:hypothetical protein L596_018723 [Steinernema carpocapsae]
MSSEPSTSENPGTEDIRDFLTQHVGEGDRKYTPCKRKERLCPVCGRSLRCMPKAENRWKHMQGHNGLHDVNLLFADKKSFRTLRKNGGEKHRFDIDDKPIIFTNLTTHLLMDVASILGDLNAEEPTASIRSEVEKPIAKSPRKPDQCELCLKLYDEVITENLEFNKLVHILSFHRNSAAYLCRLLRSDVLREAPLHVDVTRTVMMSVGIQDIIFACSKCDQSKTLQSITKNRHRCSKTKEKLQKEAEERFDSEIWSKIINPPVHSDDSDSEKSEVSILMENLAASRRPENKDEEMPTTDEEFAEIERFNESLVLTPF